MIAWICHAKGVKATEVLRLLKEKKNDVVPMKVFLAQIIRYFGREEEIEDSLKGFHARLQERIRLGVAGEKMDESDAGVEDGP